jgi:nitrogen regulatory protein PII-like uncharacterized protein
MKNEENKTVGKLSENENKTLGKFLENENKTKKMLSEEKNEEIKGFNVSEVKGLESENKTEKEEIEEEKEATELVEDQAHENSESGANSTDADDEQGDDLGFDPEDLDDIPEGGDLFEDVVNGDGTEATAETGEEPEAAKKTIKDVAQKVTSTRSAELLSKATLLALGKVDVVKAKVCSKISDQPFVEYLGDKETLELFIEAFKIWMEEREVKEPSPFATMMFMLGMWTLPPLGMALLQRFDLFESFSKTVPPTKHSPSNSLNQKNEVQGEAASDEAPQYAHVQEFQQERKKFSLNASGKYNHTPDGKTYIHAEHAEEFPSAIVKEWIKEGKKNREIINLLGYGE